MLSALDNELLCRTGSGTPMGELARRYWLPAMLSRDVPEEYSAPEPLRLLGEDLVAFRDDKGQVGILQGRCPHRGVRLTLARNEGCGLRCIYHGWLMDAHGKVLDMPADPHGETFKERVRATAYPTVEAGGLVWVYMGPDDKQPQFPGFEWTYLPEEKLYVRRILVRANYFQVLEGALDSSHGSILHGSEITLGVADLNAARRQVQSYRPTRDLQPLLEVADTDYGFQYAAHYRPSDGSTTQTWTRVTKFVAPFTCFVPSPSVTGANSHPIYLCFVPIDDETTAFNFVIYSPDAIIDRDSRQELDNHYGIAHGVGIDDRHQMIDRLEANNWRQDRKSMAAGHSFTGIDGVTLQDVVVEEAQGRIVDRSTEHLGAPDRAITRARTLLLSAARRLGETGEPAWDPVSAKYFDIRPQNALLSVGAAWQDL